MIQLNVTGGTCNKTYDHIRGKLYFNQTHIPHPQMLERSLTANVYIAIHRRYFLLNKGRKKPRRRSF